MSSSRTPALSSPSRERVAVAPADEAAALLNAVRGKLLVCAFGREIATDPLVFALGILRRCDVLDAAATCIAAAVDANIAVASTSSADAPPGLSVLTNVLTALLADSSLRAEPLTVGWVFSSAVVAVGAAATSLGRPSSFFIFCGLILWCLPDNHVE